MYKTIGIVGGMGPAATADLMIRITEMTDAACDQEHIHLIIDSNTSIPDRTEAILFGGKSPVPEMLSSAKRLENAGADFLIMSCNTAHWFIPEIENQIGIPFISMPVETARFLKARGVKTAAVLATEGTVRSGLYETALRDEGIAAIYPDDEQQKLLMSLIYDFIKSGITDPDKLPADEVAAVCRDLSDRGAEVMLLACTELPIAFDIMGLSSDVCVDPTSVLAGAAVRAAGASVRPGIRY